MLDVTRRISSETHEFFGSITERQAEDETAAAQQVECDRVFSQARPVVQRGREAVGADCDAARPREQRRHDHKDGRHVPVFREMMLGHPHRIKTGSLDKLGLLEQLDIQLVMGCPRPRRALTAVVADPKPHSHHPVRAGDEALGAEGDPGQLPRGAVGGF